MFDALNQTVQTHEVVNLKACCTCDTDHHPSIAQQALQKAKGKRLKTTERTLHETDDICCALIVDIRRYCHINYYASRYTQW
jgi:hypothetical protein